MEESNKNKSSYSGIIIFLIIFALVSLGVTYYIASNDSKASLNQNTPNNIISGDEALNDVDDFGIKSYSDYYFINNLEITNLTYTEGDYVNERGWGYYPVEIQYIEIHGLKNKEIENKINSEIKEFTTKLGKEELNEWSNRKYVTCSINANISNILSVSFWNHNYKSVALNYDLTTGNQIKFEDVFTTDANIKEILQESLYAEQSIYEPYDEIAFEWMYRFMKGDYHFIIDNEYISVCSNETGYSNIISLAKYYKDIAVFNRYRTSESIFEDENVKEIEYGFNEYQKIYHVNDNVIIYLIDYNEIYSEIFEEYTINNRVFVADKSEHKKIIDAIQNKILNIIEYAKNTPDTIHVFGVRIDEFYANAFKMEIEKNKFNNDIEQNLINKLKEQSFLYTEEEMNIENELFSYSAYAAEDAYSDFNNYYEPTSDKKIINVKNYTTSYYAYDGYYEFYNLVYNEIFARHGHDFQSNELRKKFGAKLWYLPTYGKTVTLEELNDFEKQNVEILKTKIEQVKKYPKGFFELDEMLYTVDLEYDWEEFQFSYSDDENVIGEIYTPSNYRITYNADQADAATSTTKNYFKGKYLHILLKDSTEIYQTIEIKNPFEGAMYNPETQTIDLGENWGSCVYDINTGSGITSFVLTTQRIIKLSDLGEDVRSIRLYLPMNGACDKLIEIK